MKDKLIIAAGLIILLAVVATCNRCWVRPVDTKTDTVYISVKDSTAWYRPSVTAIIGAQIPTINTVVRVDSFIAYETVPVYVNANIDTLAILKDYFAKVYYSDTTKTKYGNVIIQDTVSQNRIGARRVLTDFKIPEITKTIYPKSSRISIGVQAGYGFTNNKPSPYMGVGINYSIIKL
jgi:hypothetical protein